MTVIIHHEGDPSNNIDPMNMELAGIVDIKKALNTHGTNEVMHYLKNGAPGAIVSEQIYKPHVIIAMSQSVDDENKANGIPFGVFIATKEANPESSRNLLPRRFLEEYRSSFPIVAFNAHWKSWDEVRNEVLGISKPEIEPEHNKEISVITEEVHRRIRSIGWLNCHDGSVNLTPCVDGNAHPTLVNVTQEEFSLIRHSKEDMMVFAAKRLGITADEPQKSKSNPAPESAVSATSGRNPIRVLLSSGSAQDSEEYQVFLDSLRRLARSVIEDGGFGGPGAVIDLDKSDRAINLRLVKLDEDQYLIVDNNKRLAGNAKALYRNSLLETAALYDRWVNNRLISFDRSPITTDDLPLSKHEYNSFQGWMEIPRISFEQEFKNNQVMALDVAEVLKNPDHEYFYENVDQARELLEFFAAHAELKASVVEATNKPKFAELSINTTTAAFIDIGVETEINNILRNVAKSISPESNNRWDGRAIDISDINGNSVGVFQLVNEDNRADKPIEGTVKFTFDLSQPQFAGDRDKAIAGALLSIEAGEIIHANPNREQQLADGAVVIVANLKPEIEPVHNPLDASL